LIFGIVGLHSSQGGSVFAHGYTWALRLRTNRAFSILSIAVGALVLIAVIIGRNIDHKLGIIAGPGSIAVGVLMLALMGSDANILNFGMSTVITSFVIGTALLLNGLYGQVDTPEHAAAEEAFRHGEQSDPDSHATWGTDPSRTLEQSR
jgi:hypothetical protein